MVQRLIILGYLAFQVVHDGIWGISRGSCRVLVSRTMEIAPSENVIEVVQLVGFLLCCFLGFLLRSTEVQN